MKAAAITAILAAAAAGGVSAQVRQGGVYQITPDTLDSSGGVAGGGVYSMVTGLQSIGGAAGGGVYTLNASYTGQLGGITPGGGTGSAAFRAWQTAIFGSPDAPFAGETADPDRDTVTNFFEFVFNMDPLTAAYGTVAPGTGASGLPLIREETSGAVRFLTVEYIRLKTIGTYTVQASSDLNTWTSAGLTVLSQTSVSPDYERLKARVNPVIQPGERRYVRVKVVVD